MPEKFTTGQRVVLILGLAMVIMAGLLFVSVTKLRWELQQTIDLHGNE